MFLVPFQTVSLDVLFCWLPVLFCRSDAFIVNKIFPATANSSPSNLPEKMNKKNITFIKHVFCRWIKRCLIYPWRFLHALHSKHYKRCVFTVFRSNISFYLTHFLPWRRACLLPLARGLVVASWHKPEVLSFQHVDEPWLSIETLSCHMGHND